MKTRTLIYLLCPFMLSACTSDTQEFWEDLGKTFESKPRQSVRVTEGYPEPKGNFSQTAKKNNKNKTTQTIQNGRINTTDCADVDDWYLDGFRVGKSFRTQKSTMFQQRVQYCRGKLPSAYQQAWERGFKIGVKS